MLLLSYGGIALSEDVDHPREDVADFERALALRGITHEDLEPRNMLRSEELGKTMFIDFERSTIQTVAKRRAVLGELSPNQNQQTKRWATNTQPEDSPLKSAFLLEDSDRVQQGKVVHDVDGSLAGDDDNEAMEIDRLLGGLLPYTSPSKKSRPLISPVEKMQACVSPIKQNPGAAGTYF